MLVLSRKVGERIHVGDNITVEIRRIAGNRVTLALEAPRDVRILRGELEQAAREFEVHEITLDPHRDGAADEPYGVAAGRISVLRDLPSDTIGRDYAI